MHIFIGFVVRNQDAHKLFHGAPSSCVMIINLVSVSHAAESRRNAHHNVPQWGLQAVLKSNIKGRAMFESSTLHTPDCMASMEVRKQRGSRILGTVHSCTIGLLLHAIDSPARQYSSS